MQKLIRLFGDFDILSFFRMYLLNWIGYVNRMGGTRKVSQVFNNNPQGSRIKGRSKNGWWNWLQTDINRCKIKNWKWRSKNRADREKFIREAEVRIGL